MVFEIFKKTGEIHFDHNGIDDYDGDTGYDIHIGIPDIQVQNDVLNMIIRDYFNGKVQKTENEVIKQALDKAFTDLDLYDKVINVYYEDLKDKYEREHNNAN